MTDPTAGGGAGPDVFPAAPGQERMWFLARLEPELAVYNVNLWIPMRPGCDPGLVRRALERVVRRHEVLRTTFRMGDGGADGPGTAGRVVQEIHPSVPVEVTVTDLRHLPAADREAEFQRLARADAARPFPLDRPPLWRARLVQLGEDDQRLVWICDHTVFDGASSDPFVTEFLACYDAYAAGREPALPELPIQFADFAVWQRGQLTEERVATELAYWRQALAGLPEELGLPTDRPRPPVRSYRGEVHQFALPPELTAEVERWSARYGVTPFMTLLAAFKALLARWAGHPDVFVGVPMAGRELPELQRLIGMFVNAVVVRTDLSGDPSFLDAVRRVRASLLESIEHQELPFERIVEDLRRTRDLSRPPLYQVAFNLVPSDTRGQIANGTVKVDLALDLNLRDGRLHGRLEYATDLFDPATVHRLAETYQRLLAAALAAPETVVSRLPLLSETQRAELLALGHGPAVASPAPAVVLPDLLAAQAARTPDAPAVVTGDRRLTYAELHARAGRLAGRLRALGVGPEVPVAVCLRRRAELLVAVLAVARAGGVFAPLDPDHPPARRAFQLADSGAAVLVTEADLGDGVDQPDRPVVLVDAPDPDPTPSDPEPPRLHPEHAAYLIYTSGSTGRPKGVVTSHRSLVNRLDWMQRRFDLGPGDTVLHKTSAGFDVSIWELYWPLVTGARLVLAEPGGHRDPGYLRDEIVRSRVTIVHFVPSMLETFLAEEGVERCRSLRRIVCSGEELPRGLVERCRRRLPWVEVHNLYGPTEAAIDVSAWHCDDVTGPVPIGHPVANTRLHVLDRWLEPVPVGFRGELYLGGVQLARGYHGQPGRTAGAFLPDPHGPAGGRLYRTGDLARVRADGAVQFLGRVDGQVKIHGVRVELGEVESLLAGHPRVRRAVAAVRDDAPGGRGLVAYVDWDGDPAEAPVRLRELLATHLPATLLPQAYVLTSSFPALPSGKVDRAALPAPAAGDRTQVAAAYRAPRTPLEAELCQLWAGLLGRDRIGVDDDFFELGGHSLLVVELVGRVRERFGVELPLRRCFEVTTVAGHAREIETRREATPAGEAAPAGPGPSVLPTPRSGGDVTGPPGVGPEVEADQADTFPATVAQERIWFVTQLEPEVARYTIGAAFPLPDGTDHAGVTAAVTQVVARHAVLRTALLPPDPGGGPVRQRVHPTVPVEVAETDLRGLAPAAQEAELERIAAADATAPFALAHPPLWRARLVRLTDTVARLVWLCHHTVFDASSSDLFIAEVWECLRARADGREPDLPELPVQYADYAVWQRRQATPERVAEVTSYWQRVLAGLPEELGLPTDHPRSEVRDYRGGVHRFTLPRALTARVEQWSRRHGLTPFMTMLAAFQATLAGWTGRPDVYVGCPLAARTVPEVAPLVGMFVNAVVVRTDLTDDPSFLELAGQVRTRVLDALERQDVPVRTPRHEVMFNLVPVDSTGQLHPGTVLADLALDLNLRAGQLHGSLEYATDLFEAATMRRLADRYVALVEAALAEPERPVSELWPGPVSRVEWVDGGPLPASPTPTPELLVAQARQRPDQPAVVHAGRSLSYAQLHAAVARLAGRLAAHGAGPGRPVGVALPRGLDAVVAVLAAGHAGAPYVAVDPEGPVGRAAAVLADADPAVLVAHEVDPALRVGGRPLVSPGDPTQPGDGEVPPPAPARGPAYICYTSGSTGTPNGVVVDHAALARFVAGATARYRITSDDRVLQFAPWYGDASVEELFVTLAAGATLVVRTDQMVESVPRLLAACAEQQVTVLDLPTAYWHELVYALGTGAAALPAGIHTVIIGGEAANPARVAQWRALVPDRVRLVNTYGPTEATVVALAADLQGERDGVPIGTPLPGVRAAVVNGELYLAGGGLATGYLNRPDLTARRFAPFQGERVYRTGDLVHRRADGQFVFVGRADDEVKIGGHRVDPAGVEAVLLGHPGVRDAAVVATRAGSGAPRLTAWYVPAADPVDPAELRRHAAAMLPAAAVPAGFEVVPRIPRTGGGKVDRATLRERADAPGDAGAGPSDDRQRLVLDVWTEVLGTRPTSVHDDFFDLGGQSLQVFQVSTRLSAALGREVAVATVFQYPTVAALAAALAGEAVAADDRYPDDPVLPAEIQPTPVQPRETPPARVRPAPAARVSEPAGAVLLTGATGFVGRYLLRELLAATDLPVVCPVRAGTAEQADHRLRTAAGEAGAAGDRLRAVPADLARPRFGLDEAAFQALAREVGTVYHAAALVSLARDYGSLREVNVLGTREVLRLACTGRPSPVHHLSTVAATPFDHGYRRSKWVAEQLVAEAGRRGLPVAVYRLGRVTGPVDGSEVNPDDLIWRILRAAVEVSALPDLDLAEPWTPVDWVARTVVARSRQAGGGQVHTLAPPRPTRLAEVLDWVTGYGFDLPRLPVARWVEVAGRSAAHAPVAVPLRAAPTGPPPVVAYEVDSDCPPVDRTLVHRWLDAAVAAGLLPRPLQRAGQLGDGA